MVQDNKGSDETTKSSLLTVELASPARLWTIHFFLGAVFIQYGRYLFHSMIFSARQNSTVVFEGDSL